MNKKLVSKKDSPGRKEYTVLNACLYVLFAVLIILLCINKISGDDDFFWHLATGRYIVSFVTVPSTDIFGYATYGQQWIPFEWGWDAATYLIFSLAGYTGIYIFKTLLIILTFFIYNKILEKFKVHLSLRIFSLLLLLFSVVYRFTIRPHLVSYLFFALCLYIIITYKYFNRSNYKILYFLPAVFLVWGNFHLGAITGFLLLAIFFISEIIIYFFPGKLSSAYILKPEKKDLYRLLVILVVSAGALLINPAGITTYTYAYSHVNMKMLGDINEWKSPFDSAFNSAALIIFYKIFLGLVVFALYYAFKKKDLFVFMVCVIFAVYSLRGVRFITDYTYIVSVFIFIGISFFISRLKNAKTQNAVNTHPAGKIVLIAAIIFLMFNVLNNKLFDEYLNFHRSWGTGIDENTLPVQMFDFAKAIKLNETGEYPFNHYNCGGLFLWDFPGSKNFIDSRNISERVFTDYDIIDYKKPGFEELIKNYKIDYFMYSVDILLQSPQILKQIAVDYLSRENITWKLIYWDDKSFIYVKNEPKFQYIIAGYEYKYISPYNFLFQKQIIETALVNDRETVIKEMQRKKREDPNGFIINRMMEQYRIK